MSSYNNRELLFPCLHFLSIPEKDTLQANFKQSLRPCLKQKKDPEAEKLFLEMAKAREVACQGMGDVKYLPSDFSTDNYVQKVVEYLSLVRGFHTPASDFVEMKVASRVPSGANPGVPDPLPVAPTADKNSNEQGKDVLAEAPKFDEKMDKMIDNAPDDLPVQDSGERPPDADQERDGARLLGGEEQSSKGEHSGESDGAPNPNPAEEPPSITLSAMPTPTPAPEADSNGNSGEHTGEEKSQGNGKKPVDSDTAPLLPPADAGSSQDQAGHVGGKSGAVKRGGKYDRTLSNLLSFIQWNEALSNQLLYITNSRMEHCEMLCAAGILLLKHSETLTEKLIPNKKDEVTLKEAYSTLLSAAGVFDACLVALGCSPLQSGADYVDLSKTNVDLQRRASRGSDSEAKAREDDEFYKPSSEEMERWRQLQEESNRKKSSESVQQEGALLLENLEFFPDLIGGRLVQVLSWLALAQAQELIMFRAIQGGQDSTIVAKLAADTADRYKDILERIQKLSPLRAEIVMKGKRYCAFKDAYYQALTCYYIGESTWTKDTAEGCVKAIANFTHARTLLAKALEVVRPYEEEMPKYEKKHRQSGLQSVVTRAKQIVERDVDMATQKNHSVYYEPIPAPDAKPSPISLVRPTPFPQVPLHSIWTPALFESFDHSVTPMKGKGSGGCCTIS